MSYDIAGRRLTGESLRQPLPDPIGPKPFDWQWFRVIVWFVIAAAAFAAAAWLVVLVAVPRWLEGLK